MRIKLILLTVCCLLLFACPNSDHDNVPPVEVKEDNYLFEAEVTKQFYIQELEDLQVNDPNNTDGIQEAEDKLNNYTEFLNNLIQIVGVGVLPPPPPCPDSIIGELCLPTEGLFIVPVGVEASFRVLNGSGDELAAVNGQLQTLPNSNGMLSYFTYNFDGAINGPVLLEVTRIDGNATLIYAIPAGIRP